MTALLKYWQPLGLKSNLPTTFVVFPATAPLFLLVLVILLFCVVDGFCELDGFFELLVFCEIFSKSAKSSSRLPALATADCFAGVCVERFLAHVNCRSLVCADCTMSLSMFSTSP